MEESNPVRHSLIHDGLCMSINFFWRYALELIYYILNKILSNSESKISHEMWTGYKPALSHFRIWGCPAHVKCLKIDKLGPRSDKCLFVRYSKEIKGYYFYLADE